MSAESIIEMIGQRRGWNDESKLSLCLQYIENQCDNSAFKDFLDQQETDNVCRRCECQLTIKGRCTDIACPFNDHEQLCQVGWIGHDEHPDVNEDTPCTCNKSQE